MQRRIAEFSSVVRRDRRRHANRDPLGTVGQQIRKGPRQDNRLAFGAVIGRFEVDCVLVNAFQQEVRDLSQPRLGVAHGRWVIAIHVPEISLSIDEWVALGEILSEAHERIVYRLVSMRMELADHIPDDTGAFLECRPWIEAQLLHCVEQPPVHRLEAITRIGQRPIHDG